MYFGQKMMPNVDGGQTRVYVAAFVLSRSRYKYAQEQNRPFTSVDLVRICHDCFQYMGGMPEELVFDQDSIVCVSENAGDIIYTYEFGLVLSRRRALFQPVFFPYLLHIPGYCSLAHLLPVVFPQPVAYLGRCQVWKFPQPLQNLRLVLVQVLHPADCAAHFLVLIYRHFPIPLYCLAVDSKPPRHLPLAESRRTKLLNLAVHVIPLHSFLASIWVSVLSFYQMAASGFCGILRDGIWPLLWRGLVSFQWRVLVHFILPDVSLLETGAALTVKAWGLPQELLESSTALIQHQKELLATASGKAALPDDQLLECYDGPMTAELIWGLFETAVRLDDAQERAAIHQMALLLADALDFDEWLDRNGPVESAGK